MKKPILLALALITLVSLILGSRLVVSADNPNSQLTSRELDIITRINGTNAYNYDLDLEKIALNHSNSNYAFRSAGSTGANDAAQWIRKQFESFGLETTLEPFEFTTWNVLSQPTLIIDDDGNVSTTNDQTTIQSFQSTHFSWPTPEKGTFKDLVVLQLPDARNRNETLKRPASSILWNDVDTTDKIILIGREVRWNRYLVQILINKIRIQRPAAIIYTWWYDWMSFTPPMFNSIEGLPASSRGPYLWDFQIPVGSINYEDGLWIRNREASINVFANFTIPATIGTGQHYNVVGKLKGSVSPEKTIIISGHYDTVMTSGFCDNGAGTAGVIELARVFTSAEREGLYAPEQTLVFVAFTGEELGSVGAINYMKQHEAELKDINAVINLDCIGNDNFEVTETYAEGNELDLDQLVVKAAENLGVKAELIEPGGSDQEAFGNPVLANFYYNQFWGLDSGIVNVTRVKASVMLSSGPLFYSDQWTTGTPGWIHTQYDNSTSTSTLNWVEVNDLELHIQIAALSVIRVLSYFYNPFMSQVIAVTIIAGTIAIVAVFYERPKVSLALKRTYGSILNYVGMKETVYILILTALLLFVSFIGHTRVTTVEATVDGFPTPVRAEYMGAPFEMVGLLRLTPLSLEQAEMSAAAVVENYELSMVILWQGLVLNIILYSLLSLVITYTLTRLKETYLSKKSKIEV